MKILTINSDLRKAYEINTKIFGGIPLRLDEIKFKICESRRDFNKIFKKYHGTYPEGNHCVGFVNKNLSLLKRLFLGIRAEIFIVSKDILKKEKEFNEKYYFNILCHEMAHLFLWYKEELFHNIEESLCYYVGNQTRFHKKEWQLGKDLFNLLKKYKLEVEND